jgi:hypothetical protein
MVLADAKGGYSATSLCVCRIDRERLAAALLSGLGMEETVSGSMSKVNKKMSTICEKK